MGTVDNNGQTCLEKNGITSRDEQVARSLYNREDQYGPTHKNAISDGDTKGMGTGHGGHGAWLPSCDGTPSNAINYSNFDTTNGGNYYDIHGRNGVGGRENMLAKQLYSPENPYGANIINTEISVGLGQYKVK